MGRQRGASLVELLAVLAVAGLAIGAIGVGSLTWIRRQASTSAVYHVQAALRSARAEAVTRNRACRFVVEPAARTLRVLDLNFPGDGTDDAQISGLMLASAVRFARPDGGAAVSLPAVGGGAHEATFEADGTVSSGAGGQLFVQGGDTFHRVTVYGAGSVRVERWAGGAWVAGR